MKMNARKEMEEIEKYVSWRDAAAKKGNKKRAQVITDCINIRLEELADNLMGFRVN